MIFLYNTVCKSTRSFSSGEVTEMEVKDALALMFAFGMFILALLAYIKKK